MIQARITLPNKRFRKRYASKWFVKNFLSSQVFRMTQAKETGNTAKHIAMICTANLCI